MFCKRSWGTTSLMFPVCEESCIVWKIMWLGSPSLQQSLRARIYSPPETFAKPRIHQLSQPTKSRGNYSYYISQIIGNADEQLFQAFLSKTVYFQNYWKFRRQGFTRYIYVCIYVYYMYMHIYIYILYSSSSSSGSSIVAVYHPRSSISIAPVV